MAEIHNASDLLIALAMLEQVKAIEAEYAAKKVAAKHKRSRRLDDLAQRAMAALEDTATTKPA